jgi:hypothetical protein
MEYCPNSLPMLVFLIKDGSKVASSKVEPSNFISSKVEPIEEGKDSLLSE